MITVNLFTDLAPELSKWSFRQHTFYMSDSDLSQVYLRFQVDPLLVQPTMMVQ